MELSYKSLMDEVITTLENTQTMTLATCVEGRVTARTMAIVNDGTTLLFQTNGFSEKIRQLNKNNNVAFASDNLQVEAVANITYDQEITQIFVEKYKVKYPQYYAVYSGMPDEVTVICIPIRFALYKFIEGKPYKDVLDVVNNRAYRDVLINPELI